MRDNEPHAQQCNGQNTTTTEHVSQHHTNQYIDELMHAYAGEIITACENTYPAHYKIL